MAKRPENVTAFLDVVAPIVLHLCPVCLYPSVVIAQAALESGWNMKAKTLFGIKGKGTAGSVNVKTQEQNPDGSIVKIKDDFAAYSNLTESVQGYIDLIMGQGQYKTVTRYAPARSAQNPESMITLIHLAGYATALNYASEVMGVIRCFGLTEYDAGHGVQK